MDAESYYSFENLAKRLRPGEPALGLRGQDKHFEAMLAHYIDLLAEDPETDVRVLASAHKLMTHTTLWKENHTTKAPDMPDVASPSKGV